MSRRRREWQAAPRLRIRVMRMTVCWQNRTSASVSGWVAMTAGHAHIRPWSRRPATPAAGASQRARRAAVSSARSALPGFPRRTFNAVGTDLRPLHLISKHSVCGGVRRGARQFPGVASQQIQAAPAVATIAISLRQSRSCRPSSASWHRHGRPILVLAHVRPPSLKGTM